MFEKRNILFSIEKMSGNSIDLGRRNFFFDKTTPQKFSKEELIQKDHFY